MNIKLDLSSITINSKEELKELLKEIDYRPSLYGTQFEMKGTPNRGDALPWDMMDFFIEFIEEYFEPILGLRKENPDLHERLSTFVEFINIKLQECINTWEVMKSAEKIDHTKRSIDRNKE